MPYDDRLRQAWATAGYRTDMGSAAVCLPPAQDKIRLYHLTAADHALSNLKHERLKVARFADLNDPFELMALNFREREIRKVVREFKSISDSHTGLLCFSEDWTSPVMWGHYAQKHRGICLGFDVPRRTVQKVQYADARIRAELDESGNPFTLSPELQALLMCTKCDEWKYEEEQRRFVPLVEAMVDGALHFWPFGEELKLAEVILGPNCATPIAEVRKIVREKFDNVCVIQARLAWKFFAVVPKESTVP